MILFFSDVKLKKNLNDQTYVTDFAKLCKTFLFSICDVQ